MTPLAESTARTGTSGPPVDRGSIRPDVHAVALAVAELVRRSDPAVGATRVVAVDGRSGSGKSTVACSLAAALPAPVINLDDLYPGWDGLADVTRRVRDWVIEPLRAGRDPRWRRYDWDRGRYGGWVTTPRAEYLVVEGCGAGGRLIAPALSLLVWVDVPQEQRARRLAGRPDWSSYAPHAARWSAQETALLAREGTPDRADVHIRNTTPIGVSLVSDRARLLHAGEPGSAHPEVST